MSNERLVTVSLPYEEYKKLCYYEKKHGELERYIINLEHDIIALNQKVEKGK